MTWGQWVPALVVALSALTLPGGALLLAAGLRPTVALALAPATSVTLVWSAAVLAAALGLWWGWLPVLGLTAVCSLAAALARLLAGRRARGRGARGRGARLDPGAVLVGLGAAAATALAGVRLAGAFARPDAVSQTYDAVFHLNALRYIADTGAATSAAVTALTTTTPTNTYPAAWHAVASLVLPAAAGSPPAAANAVAVAIVCLVWPAGCALLARQVLGSGRPASVATAVVLAQAFAASPWLILSWGVLWPQALGTALVPAVLAAAMSVTGLARHDVLRGPGPGLAVLVVTTLACGVAHPGAALIAALLSLVLTVTALGAAALRLRRRGRPGPASVLLVAAGVLPVLSWVLLQRLPNLASLRRFDWAATESVPGAVAQVLLHSPAGAAPAFAVSALVLVGVAVSLRRPGTVWLVVGLVVTGVLDVLAAAVDSGLSQLLTGFWYNDRYRLAAVVPVVGVPLAVLGARALAGAARPRSPARPVGLAVVVLAAVWHGTGEGAGVVAERYRLAERSGPGQLVDEPEQRFLEQLDRYVPEGSVVAGSPWNGSSLAYALGGTPVLFPHFGGPRPPDSVLIADGLHRLATDPAVCAALAREQVRYVLEDIRTFSPPPLVAGGYEGLQDLQDVAGLEQVASSGPVTLYEVTGCAGP